MKGRPKLEIVGVEGEATEADLAAVKAALEHALAEEQQARAASIWLRSGRAQGRRLGMYDYRDRFKADEAWRLSLRFPPGGREYSGLHGRGDAK